MPAGAKSSPRRCNQGLWKDRKGTAIHRTPSLEHGLPVPGGHENPRKSPTEIITISAKPQPPNETMMNTNGPHPPNSCHSCESSCTSPNILAPKKYAPPHLSTNYGC